MEVTVEHQENIRLVTQGIVDIGAPDTEVGAGVDNAVADDNRSLIEIGGENTIRPIEEACCRRGVVEVDDDKVHAAGAEEGVAALVVSGRITFAVETLAAGGIGGAEAGYAEVGVVERSFIMVAWHNAIWNVRRIEDCHGSIRVVPFCSASGVIDDVALMNDIDDIEGVFIVDDPLRLGGEDRGVAGGVVLRIRQDNDREVLRCSFTCLTPVEGDIKRIGLRIGYRYLKGR